MWGLSPPPAPLSFPRGIFGDPLVSPRAPEERPDVLGGRGDTGDSGREGRGWHWGSGGGAGAAVSAGPGGTRGDIGDNGDNGDTAGDIAGDIAGDRGGAVPARPRPAGGARPGRRSPGRARALLRAGRGALPLQPHPHRPLRPPQVRDSEMAASGREEGGRGRLCRSQLRAPGDLRDPADEEILTPPVPSVSPPCPLHVPKPQDPPALNPRHHRHGKIGIFPLKMEIWDIFPP